MVQYQVGATFKEVKLKLNQVLKKYYKFTKLWDLGSEKLIKYILWDYKIKLKLEIILKFFLIYKLIKIKNLILKKFIKKNLKKEYIQLLQLLVKYLVLFILKKNKKLKIYINY